LSKILVHSDVTDCLPDAHLLAFEDVYCDTCGAMLHALNNECMQTWVECERQNLCAGCYGPHRSSFKRALALEVKGQ
jgi:hypothetical protein